MSHDPTEAAARLTEDLAALDPGQEAILLRNTKARHVGSILIDDIRALIPLAARVVELEGELDDAREANRNMRDAVKRRREGQPCGSPLVHAPHHWMLVDEVMQCPGNRWTAAPDRSDGSEQ